LSYVAHVHVTSRSLNPKTGTHPIYLIFPLTSAPGASCSSCGWCIHGCVPESWRRS